MSGGQGSKTRLTHNRKCKGKKKFGDKLAVSKATSFSEREQLTVFACNSLLGKTGCTVLDGPGCQISSTGSLVRNSHSSTTEVPLLQWGAFYQALETGNGGGESPAAQVRGVWMQKS